MIKRLYERYYNLIWEIFRYLLVGGFATIVDMGVLFLTQEFIFPKEQFINGIDWGLTSATTLGFISGLIVNYILSVIFVFKNTKNKDSGKSVKEFILFAIIGIIGLLLTIGGMHLLVVMIGIYYIIAKVVMTIIVLAWNYIARKVLIFK